MLGMSPRCAAAYALAREICNSLATSGQRLRNAGSRVLSSSFTVCSSSDPADAAPVPTSYIVSMRIQCQVRLAHGIKTSVGSPGHFWRRKMSRGPKDLVQITLRLREDLRLRLQSAAELSGESLNTEM